MSIPAGLTSEDCMSHLCEVVGHEHARLSGKTIDLAPADTQQIADILRFANENSLAVVPTGSGSKLGWGNPVVAAIQLSLQRINALREHAWQDLTCTVDAGCTWAAMQAELALHGQMVALDPLWPQRATVGGIIAANDSGAMRLKYGGLRDLIIGMTVVLADGTIAKTGGKVVKNVAGYDLHKLMTGSFGTLGVIAQVNFRLHPLEVHAQTWTAIAPDPSYLDAPLRALMNLQMTPSCVQFRASNHECALDIHIASLPECLDEYAGRLRHIFPQIDRSDPDDQVGQARQELFDRKHAILLKVTMLPSEICPISLELIQQASAQGTMIAIVAQATGLTTIALKSAADSDIAPAVALIDLLRARLHATGGSVVALQIPDTLRGNLDVWGANPSALPLMREIKRRFDPNRILNPGRFVGNI